MGLFEKILGKSTKENVHETIGRQISCQPKTVYSPLLGMVVPLAQVKDGVFSEGIMGPGVGIEPEDGRLYAPVDGEVLAVFPTGHAVGIRTKEGMEILLHIGIDTVQMNGDGFQIKVNQGERVHAGDLLVVFDLGKIKKAGYKATTMVLVSNAADMGVMTEPAIGKVNVLDRLYSF